MLQCGILAWWRCRHHLDVGGGGGGGLRGEEASTQQSDLGVSTPRAHRQLHRAPWYATTAVRVHGYTMVCYTAWANNGLLHSMGAQWSVT